MCKHMTSNKFTNRTRETNFAQTYYDVILNNADSLTTSYQTHIFTNATRCTSMQLKLARLINT